MRIQYKSYFIDPCDNANERFDLKRTIYRTKKLPKGSTETPETYPAEDEDGFGMTLVQCFEKIIAEEIVRGHKDDILTPQEYLDEYKREKAELKEYIESKTTIKIN